jgi:putative ABC transport system permease protein
MTPFRLALLSLTRRKVTSFIALISIALSVACSGVLLRMYELSGSRFATMGDGGDAIVGAKAGGIEILLNSLNAEGNYPDYLPYSLFASLRAQQTVHFEDGAQSQPDYLRLVIPVLFFAKHNGYRVMGTDATFFQRPDSPHAVIVREGRVAQADREIVVGAALAEREHLKLGSEISATSWTSGDTDGSEIPFKVVGILNRTAKLWDNMSFATVEQAQTVIALAGNLNGSIWGNRVLNYFFVYLKPNGEEALRKLINGRTVGQVAFVSSEKQKLLDLTGTGRDLGFLMAAFIIGLGGLCVAAMLITRFDAMALQIAVLRAIGYGRRKVSAWLMLEGILLGVAACFIGGLLDAALFPMFRAMLGAALPTEELASISIWHSAPVWIAAILSTVVAVVIPLVRFYRQDVHLSLRSV